MKTTTIAALLALTLSSTAMADSVHIDWTGTGYAFDSTESFNRLDIKYRSVTTITDITGDGLSVGDTIVTNGGMALASTYYAQDWFDHTGFAGNAAQLNVAAIGENIVTGVDPGTYFDSNAPGYADVLPTDYSANGSVGNGDWSLTFSLVNLLGTFDGNYFDYSSGTIIMQLWNTAAQTVTDLFTLDLNGGGYDAANANFIGALLDTVLVDSFYADPTGESFEAYNDNVLNDTNVRFSVNQNTDNSKSGQALIDEVNDDGVKIGSGAGSLIVISGKHSGGIEFNVPEPTSIAILGLGLLGFAGVRRRKS